MRLVDADVIRERVQDFFNIVKAEGTPLTSTETKLIEVINRSMLDIIDTTPTKYTTRGY